jgi:hypothetical protein
MFSGATSSMWTGGWIEGIASSRSGVRQVH